MTETGLDEGRLVRDTIEPVMEAAGFGLEAIGRWCFEMHPLAADGAGHHLHGPAGIVAPAADLDLGESGVTGGNQSGMPTEQTLPCYRSLAVGRGTYRHLDPALDVPIDRGKRTDVHAQPARDGRAHRFDIELLAL